jgi:hypothetical protein
MEEVIYFLESSFLELVKNLETLTLVIINLPGILSIYLSPFSLIPRALGKQGLKVNETLGILCRLPCRICWHRLLCTLYRTCYSMHEYPVEMNNNF